MCSCFTPKKVKREIKAVFNKYNAKSNIDSVNIKAFFKKENKRLFKRDLIALERKLALSPDSLHITGGLLTDSTGLSTFVPGQVDSIYWNANKIKYLKRNNLLTERKILITQ